MSKLGSGNTDILNSIPIPIKYIPNIIQLLRILEPFPPIKLDQNPFILTDDGELLAECIQTNKNATNLTYFLLEAVKQGKLTKNKFDKALTFWNRTHSYPKKHIVKWKKDLQEIV